jgi:aspartyl-tRNA(Asn)/glutamyl-tRNA(Gln) amidotransferase subunit B
VVCEICAGLPGTLPSLNARAVEFAVRVALALNCEIRTTSIFARKNYFYPDLPKGYQISQYELPLAVNGWLEIETPRGPQRVRIRRVHLEEDTGKLNHVSALTPGPSPEGRGGEEHSLVDLNRAGVPLLEIVTEPDLHSAEDVKAYAVALRAILRYLGVNSGDMEKGILRFEPNISVRPSGSAELRTRTELKNLNSFRVVERGTLFEIERQIKVWESGGTVIQETRGWDEAKGETVGQRGKEHAHDYRYFPEPDLPPLVLTEEFIAPVRAALPELPAAKRARFQTEYGLSAYDAAVLTEEKAVADYFEKAISYKPLAINPKAVANWMTGELFRLMNESGQSIEQIKVSPENLAALSELVAANTLNSNTAKTVLAEMFQSGHAPQAIVEANGLAQVSDNSALEKLVAEVLAANPEQVASYVGGKLTLEQWFFGQVMKQSKGRGNPQVIKEILAEKLAQLKT